MPFLSGELQTLAQSQAQAQALVRNGGGGGGGNASVALRGQCGVHTPSWVCVEGIGPGSSKTRREKLGGH